MASPEDIAKLRDAAAAFEMALNEFPGKEELVVDIHAPVNEISIQTLSARELSFAELGHWVVRIQRKIKPEKVFP